MEILRVNSGQVRVEDARGQPPTMPFWIGEAPGRTNEVSTAVSDLREEIERVIRENSGGTKFETQMSKSEANPNVEFGKIEG